MKLRLFLAAAALVGAAACGDTSPSVGPECPRATIPALSGDTVRTASGLKYLVRQQGTGATAQAGATVTVHYTGYLTNGIRFDSSVERGQPAVFSLTQVIPGFAEGITGMKVGESRRLVIPPQLGYGSAGAGLCIPGGSTLIFDVDLIAVR